MSGYPIQAFGPKTEKGSRKDELSPIIVDAVLIMQNSLDIKFALPTLHIDGIVYQITTFWVTPWTTKFKGFFATTEHLVQSSRHSHL